MICPPGVTCEDWQSSPRRTLRSTHHSFRRASILWKPRELRGHRLRVARDLRFCFTDTLLSPSQSACMRPAVIELPLSIMLVQQPPDGEYVPSHTISSKALRMVPVGSGSKLLIKSRKAMSRLTLIKVVRPSAKDSSTMFHHYSRSQPVSRSVPEYYHHQSLDPTEAAAVASWSC